MASASPAMAWDEPYPYTSIHSHHASNAQGIGVETCRAVEVAAVIGVILHNVLAQDREDGNCDNGSMEGRNGNGAGYDGYRH
ncbi:hypothetical protein AB0L06_33585 [Spirillospora sp. NPDC052269]